MAAITIRDLDDSVKERLRVQAAINGRSMEAEARQILESGLRGPYAGMNIGQAYRAMAESVGFLDDLVLPTREEAFERPTPFSDEWEQLEAERDSREQPDR